MEALPTPAFAVGDIVNVKFGVPVRSSARLVIKKIMYGIALILHAVSVPDRPLTASNCTKFAPLLLALCSMQKRARTTICMTSTEVDDLL